MMQERSYISNFKIILSLIIFFICIIPIYNYIGNKYSEVEEKNIINAFTKSRFDDFYSLPKNTLDMVFIGSSHSYCTFNPENFDNRFGISSFQMGTPSQHADTSYYVLKEVLKTQSPKFVVMELYWDVLDEDFEMKQANLFFEVVNDKNVKSEYIKEVFPLNEKVKYNILPIKYQQDYFAYKASEMQKNIEEKYKIKKEDVLEVEGTEYYLAKGYTYCDIIIPENEFDETNQFKNFDGDNWEINNVQKKYLLKILDLCHSNDINVIFVTAPIANVSMDFIKNYDDIHNELSEFAKSVNCNYIDFNIINKTENLFENKNFRDDAHLNDSGVQIADEYFGNWLEQNNILLENKSN